MSETSAAYYRKMTETPVSRLIVALGIPTTVSMLISGIYNLADTYFVGQWGESAQGATGILFTLQTIIQAIAFTLGHGSGTYVSRALAKQDTEEATRFVSTAFFTGAAVGTVLTVFGLIFLTPFMRLLGSTETILPYAVDYGFWVLISAPFMICSLVLNNNLRYEGKAFFSMIGLSCGGVLNIFGDWLLVSRCAWGVWGAGLATAVSQGVSFTLLLILYRRHAQSTVSLRAVSRRAEDYFGMIRVGLPSLCRQGLSSLSSGLLNNFTKPFGDAAIAAISVVNRFSMLLVCVGLGIGQGFQPVAAFNYAAGQRHRVRRGLIFTTLFGFCLVGVLTVGGFCFAPSLIRIFQKSEAVVEIGVPALHYACGGLLFMPLSVPVNMLYQSIQEAGTATFLSLTRSGLLFIPVLIVFSRCFGLIGILLSQPLADVLTGLVSLPFIIAFMRRPDVQRIRA